MRSRLRPIICTCLAVFCAAALARPAAAAPPGAVRRHPNLRGEIMILVYHRFGPKDSRWTRAYSSFDRDLAELEAQGYRPITLRAYATGDTATPAGTTPVVITFDDSTNHQVKFTPGGQIAPDCALAHWLAFSRRHPDFPFRGVFFINPGPYGRSAFDQPRFALAKMKLILKLGGEIGNHTLTHANLRHSTPAQVRREIGLAQYYLRRELPGYAVVSFALPYGEYPNPRSLSWQGVWTETNAGRGLPASVRWQYRSVVKVGAGPAPSPLVAGFDPHFLPRIQAFDPEIDHWLRYFQLHPHLRFVSDGQDHSLAPPPGLGMDQGRVRRGPAGAQAELAPTATPGRR